MKIPFEEKIRMRQQSMKKRIHTFCSYNYMDRDFELLCCNLVDLMAQQDDVMFMQGKNKNWVSAVIYLIASENYMFDNIIFDTMRHEDIEEFFNSHYEFYCQLARRIDDKLNIRDNPDFHIKDREDLDTRGWYYINDEGNLFYIESNGTSHRIY